MAAVPALATSETPLFAAFTIDGRPMPEDEAQKLKTALEAVLPDLLVHGTHTALVGISGSIGKASGEAHLYFARVSQMLAFEGMMRNFMRMSAAMSPFPIDALAANFWSQMFAPTQHMPAPWAYPAPPQQPQVLSLWAFVTPQQPQTPPVPWAYLGPAQSQAPVLLQLLQSAMQPRSMTPAQQQAWPDYSPLFIIPIALLAAAPAAQSWWNLGLPL